MDALKSLTSVFACVVCLFGVGQAQQPALRFLPLTVPCRIADTRNANGNFGGPAIGAGGVHSFPILTSPCLSGTPSTVAAYSLNVTAIPATSSGLGFLTIWQTGQPLPLVSTLNSLDGRIKANAAIVPAGTGGAISVFATDPTNVVLDINGVFVPASDPSKPLAFFALPPCRVADTRNASGPLGGPSLTPWQARAFPVLSSSCIPSNSNALAYSLIVTAVPQGPLGFLSPWPSGTAWPGVSDAERRSDRHAGGECRYRPGNG